MDHAIAKMTEQQQQQEAATERVTDKDNVTPTENISQPAPSAVADNNPKVSKPKGDTDAKGSSPPPKGEFKTTMHALKKKVETKHSYKCHVCGARKSRMHLLNDHHKHHHEPQMCGICSHVFALASSLNWSKDTIAINVILPVTSKAS